MYGEAPVNLAPCALSSRNTLTPVQIREVQVGEIQRCRSR